MEKWTPLDGMVQVGWRSCVSFANCLVREEMRRFMLKYDARDSRTFGADEEL